MITNNTKLVDHLFRHHYGKMVATLVRLFGLDNMELIEDAVQDTFINAMSSWKNGIPPNPEGWLTKSAKNRAIDIIRKIKSETNRITTHTTTPTEEAVEHVFLDYQVEDSQLRMIFTACHPALDPKDQIAFALKTIAGFNDKEIATALLLNLDTVKKRLTRARKTIKEEQINFSIPDKEEMKTRRTYVHNVFYLIFNEGFHSTKQNSIVRKDLCEEAIRLISLLLKKPYLRSGEGYALFGLFCFHAARLPAKLSEINQLIDLKNQDRSKWNKNLFSLGNNAMNKSLEYKDTSDYHIEAAIAAEHLLAKTYEDTNWLKILGFYEILHANNNSSFSHMNLAFAHIQLNNFEYAKNHIDQVTPSSLGKRAYLFYGIKAEYHLSKGEKLKAIQFLDQTINHVTNTSEKVYLTKKRESLS